MEGSSATFGVVDYIVFAAMLIVSAAVGVYFQFTGGKQRTTEEIILGDKKMSVMPVAFSLMASFASAIGMLGFSAENYLFGFHLALFSIVTFISTFIIIYVYHPVFYNMQITTVYEYLDRRFGKPTRIIGSLAFMFRMIFYMAVVLYAPALAMSAVTGISMWASILSVGIVCTFYCTIGGIKAVLWTDLIQGLIMYATMITVIVKGSLDVGGITNVWKIATEGGRTEMASFTADPTVRYTFWSIFIGGISFHLATNAVTQTQVQRMMTLDSIKKSRRAIWASVPLKTIHTLFTCFCGVILYSSFGSCDPLLNKKETKLSSYDQLLPYFIMKSLGKFPGLPGLCIAGLFSASLSTLSSVINSLAAVTLEDFIRPNCCLQSMTESRAAFITKMLALAFGILCILLSYMVEKLGGLMEATITISGVLGGPMLGLFTLGMLFERPNQKGAISGLLISLAFCFWISFGTRTSKFKSIKLPLSLSGCPNSSYVFENGTNYALISKNNQTFIIDDVDNSDVFPLYKLSYMWYSVTGCVSTILLGYIISLFTGPNKEIEPELLSPVVIWGSRHKSNNIKKKISSKGATNENYDSNGEVLKEKKNANEDKSPSCYVISSSTTGLYSEDKNNSTSNYAGDIANPSYDDKTITTVL
ncbi:putative sodium-dependent multivitamin transporter isoform X2 [Centruroides sculpturatus]|nr:putative sodium-dependent multivitamin transporter isoform X2 [Centruroides sculpturatus]XP_023215231.1 putative sodium-dependent multivitamin transporter isoform X2 [Centruroides sculpturatus]XP_023215232.1 putative sodium-dependent multivitamin transporter isoform X2 [Centruroides sculpturatus]